MPAIEATANDPESAISSGLAQLGLIRAEVKIEILDEGSKGVLGFGSRQARVRLTPLSEMEAEASHAALPAASELTPAPAAEAPRPAAPAQAAPAAPADKRIAAPEDHARARVVPPEDIALAQEFTQGLLDRMDFDTQVEAATVTHNDDDEYPSIRVSITGEDADLLLNHQMEVLNALQVVVQSMWSHQTKSNARLTLDANDYRALREQRVQQMAVRMAERVVESGKPITLEPMLPSERRLVHIALRGFPGVYTESIGEGGSRRVQIKPEH